MASSGWPAGVARAHTHVPVVVEADAFSSVVGKARLLEANTPKRTVSPMDEARVVHSLVTDDHLSPTQITKLLGRGRGWVDRRVTLGQRLAPECARHLDAGRLSATTAHALAGLPAAGAAAPGREPRAPRAAHPRGRGHARDLARGLRHADPGGAAARSAPRHAGARRARGLPARAHRARAAGALPPDRARPAGARAARSHRLPRPRPPRPRRLPTAAGRPRPPTRPHPSEGARHHADPRGTGRTAAPGAGPHPDPRHGPAPEPRRQDDPPSPGPLARAPRRPRRRSWRPTTR